MDFYQRVSIIGEWIPYGKVVTYGQIALLCGRPNGSRQVGYALRSGKAGNNFPAYRVVNSQGFLSGAASFAEADTQKKLLQSEGINVSGEERVKLSEYQWHHSVDEAEALYQLFQKQGI